MTFRQTGRMDSNILKLVTNDNIGEAKKHLQPRVSEVTSTNYSFPEQVAYVSSSNLGLIHVAAYYNSIECFMWLVEHCQVPITQPSAENYKPIHYACLGSSTEIVSYILSKNEPDGRESQEARVETNTPFQALFLAVISGNCQIIRMLFDHGCDTQSPKNKADHAIKKAIALHYIDVIKLLLSASAKNDGYEQDTALMFAIRRGEYEAVPLLLDAGEDPSVIITKPDGTAECALALACIQKNFGAVQAICNKLGPRVRPPPDYARTLSPVHWICSSESADIARIILQHDIDVNATDSKDQCGVLLFLGRPNKKDHLTILDMLYDKGFDLNAKRRKPILLEYVEGLNPKAEIIEWMLNHGADPFVPISNGSNQTVYDRAIAIPKLSGLFLRYAPK